MGKCLLSRDEKLMLYSGFNCELDGSPYIELGSIEEFFGENNPTKGISLLRRIYYTIFPKPSD